MTGNEVTIFQLDDKEAVSDTMNEMWAQPPKFGPRLKA